MRNFWNWFLRLQDEEDTLFNRESDFNSNPDRSVEISTSLIILKLFDYSIFIPFWLFIYTIILPYLLYKIHIPSLLVNALIVISLIVYLNREFNTLNRIILFRSSWKQYVFVFILFNIIEILGSTSCLIDKHPLKGEWYHMFFNPSINYIGLCITLNFVLIIRMIVYTYQKIQYHRKYILKQKH